MRILIIGSGAREHALTWKISQSPLCDAVFCAPGNAGIAEIADCVPIGVLDFAAQIRWARANAIDLVIVGPEDPLAHGIADVLSAEGLRVFGPSQAAARIESSKAFLKDLVQAKGIPCAKSADFTASGLAHQFLDRLTPPYVIKADGLAQGKGVVIAETFGEAQRAIDAMLSGSLGEAGQRIVIEEFLEGEEASLFALCDGREFVLLGGAQDHKRAYDGDKGPNTGGMGAYAPAAVLTDRAVGLAAQKIIAPTLAAMADRGAPFRGVLFAGLMIGREGPKLIEFNARFGDPECQTLMPLMDADFLAGILAAMEGSLLDWEPALSRDAAMTVVMAAQGYPGAYAKGTEIRGVEKAEALRGVHVFHAGTERDPSGRLLQRGGRTLSLTARGPTLQDAQARAYRAIDLIEWPEGFCRRDIGWRALG